VVLDVRPDAEFTTGHLPDPRHVELGELPVRAGEVPGAPTVVTCGRGDRL